MSTSLLEFYQSSLIFWSHLIHLVLQFIQTNCWNHITQKEQQQEELNEPCAISKTMDAFVEEQQKRAQRKAQEYAKVELLHRLLVQQQLQELEQRRLIRLALARRRLDYSN
ncbi:GD24492 [Drosophila simulans]|uniref:GD24492 n=1 Tax=Drosophila simulans TaxID=7240 RepID=B4NUK0_DROSI|nr:GD24492 [Drosophila simulans]